MSLNLVSVIIPAYNAEHTLERAVKSAASQTYENLEILIVNDGSADGTLALAERLAERDPRIRVLDRKNGGVSRARNEGLGAARGELITFLDADDWLEPTMVGRLAALREEEQADFAGCGFTGGRAPGSGSGKITLRVGADIVREGILQHDTRVWSKLFTRRCLENAAFPEGLTIGEDMLFLLDAVGENTRYAALDLALYGYEENPEGAMEKPFVPSYFDQVTCWDLAEKRIGEKFPALLDEEDTRGRLAAIQAVSAMLTAGKLALLPKRERGRYRSRIQELSAYVKERWREKAMRAFLPQGYGVKIRLFLLSPKLYFPVMSRIEKSRRKTKP